MKARTLACLAGVSAPLIAADTVPAGFVEIEFTTKSNPFGLLVVNVYAEFDREGEDFMLAVAGTAATALQIAVDNGTFYQHKAGTDRPPSTFLVGIFPSLAFDTFVTVGVKATGTNGQPADNMTITPGWPGFGASTLTTDSGAWLVFPGQDQGDPFNPAVSYPGDGRILIGQFTTADGTRIHGSMLIQYISNGVQEQQHACFDTNEPCDCVGDCDLFDGVIGINDFLALLAEWDLFGTPCDLDGGGVGITDMLLLLANWGPCLPQPVGACCLPDDTCEDRTQGQCGADGGTWRFAGTTCDDYAGMADICTNACPWDCGEVNGDVDVVDFLALLGDWGMTGTPCDFGLGLSSIESADLLNMIANWGACP